jgi:putative heme-binding domain-containing protein
MGTDADRALQASALLALPEPPAAALEAARELLGPASPPDLQQKVVEALGEAPHDGIAALLCSAWPNLTGPIREAALHQLLRRPAWALRLVEEIEAGRIRGLGPGAAFRLRHHPDAAVAARGSAALDAAEGPERKGKDEVIAALLPAVLAPGDTPRGRDLLARNCLVCHAYRGEGRDVAPDLTGLGAHPPAELLTHILDPNRAVEPNYVSINVRLRNGEVFNGILFRETEESIVLRGAEGDREVRRSDIEEAASTGMSLMPTGFESLGAEALRDIIAFLASDAGGFRFVDLSTACTASTVRGLYDPDREPANLRLARFGRVEAGAIPFLILDPARTEGGNNAIVLKGGSVADWHSKTGLPRKVEVPVGLAVEKLHVLGGIAAWGATGPGRGEPAVRVTYRYEDGAAEETVLYDGVEFADWIRRVDVPGSAHAEGLVKEGAPGQVRWFTLVPPRRGPIRSLDLESYDNHLAPTFLAITAEPAR